MGGTPVGLRKAYPALAIMTRDRDHKTVTEGMLGLSRVLTRRWLFGLNGSRVHEDGYLTEPYKVVSARLPWERCSPTASSRKSAPTRRNRSDVLASSVYHLPGR